MLNSLRRVFVLLASVAVAAALLSVGPAAARAGAATASDPAGTAKITGGICAGDTETLSWTAPYPGVLDYLIVENGSSANQNLILPPTQTSLTFQVQLYRGGNAPFSSQTFTLAAETREHPFTQFAQVSTGPFRFPPSPFNWDGSSRNVTPPNAVGNGFVTVAFVYHQFDLRLTGGQGPNTVTVTASPGGRTQTAPLSLSGPGSDPYQTFTFTGLANGTPYTFFATVSNDCGSAVGSGSAPLTPVGPPVLTCAVTSTQVPPAVKKATQSVTVQSVYGLASITNVAIVNGTVQVPKFTVGTTAPVVVTATKTTAGKPTSWSFDITDVNGNPQHCA
ncbi:MAG: hypothetical protein M3083_00405 [Actinomycetota bacterium]|nr:hypothetical protein [Actinomycetota bacterium]